MGFASCSRRSDSGRSNGSRASAVTSTRWSRLPGTPTLTTSMILRVRRSRSRGRRSRRSDCRSSVTWQRSRRRSSGCRPAPTGCVRAADGRSRRPGLRRGSRHEHASDAPLLRPEPAPHHTSAAYSSRCRWGRRAQIRRRSTAHWGAVLPPAANRRMRIRSRPSRPSPTSRLTVMRRPASGRRRMPIPARSLGSVGGSM